MTTAFVHTIKVNGVQNNPTGPYCFLFIYVSIFYIGFCVAFMFTILHPVYWICGLPLNERL